MGILYIFLGIILLILAILFIYAKKEQSLMANHNYMLKKDNQVYIFSFIFKNI